MTRVDEKMVRASAQAAFGALDRTPREDLLWATVILSSETVDLPNDGGGLLAASICTQVDEFRESWLQALRRSGRIGRGGTRWAGAIELDLIHPAMMGGAHKARLLNALGVQAPLHPSQRVIVPHLHSVVDNRGHGQRLRAALCTKFPGPYRVVLKPIEARPVSVELASLASYSTKFKMRYSESWGGRMTKYHANFENEWKDVVRRVYYDLGQGRIVFTNMTSRARSRVI